MPEIALSLEETNKLRISLGLRPLEPEPDNETQPEPKREPGPVPKESTLASQLERFHKEKSLRNELSSGTDLGSVPSTSTESWIKSLHKPKKPRTSSRPSDDAKSAPTYDETALKGLQISHDADDFAYGDTVLTLHDKGVLDDDEDVLENVNISDKKHAIQATERRKGPPQYAGVDAESKDILSQYDTESDAGFRIGDQNSASASRAPSVDSFATAAADTSTDVSLGNIASDFVDASDSLVTKWKKKSKKHRPSRQATSSVPELIDQATVYDDQDELQQSLAKQRSSILRKRPRSSAPSSVVPQAFVQQDSTAASNGIVMNMTSEFVTQVERMRDGQDHHNGQAHEGNENDDNVSPGGAQKDVSPASETSETDLPQENVPQDGPSDETPALTDETPAMSDSSPGGLAATLNLLRSQGAVQSRTEEHFTAGDSHIPDESEDPLKGYKPKFNIVYRDEFGRDLDQREAWKEMSHQFHGTFSGPAKREKKLKKIEQERKALYAAHADSTRLASSQREHAERTGDAAVVLSIDPALKPEPKEEPVPLETVSPGNGNQRQQDNPSRAAPKTFIPPALRRKMGSSK